MRSPALRIALLAHSTIPRGGVVHALALGDALTRLGHAVVVHAPDESGEGFFRKPLCDTRTIPAKPAGPGTLAMVEARVADYLRHFEAPAHRRFDIFHAQDGISGNALATLKAAGAIPGFARTVHHLDTFADARLSALQQRSVVEADAHLVVSPLWRRCLEAEFGVAATVVGNGVDASRFRPQADGRESLLRRRLGLGGGPVFLSVGGVEERKNSSRILQAFIEVQKLVPDAQWIVAGGRSLLDHRDYRAGFDSVLQAAALPSQAVVMTGPLAEEDMPALYRVADALVFPSLKEGYGLVVLEAMASGLPVVTSRIPPFTDYLAEADAVWCEPSHVGSIADAMLIALAPEHRRRLAGRGLAVAARHDWHAAARLHLPAYATLGSPVHA